MSEPQIWYDPVKMEYTLHDGGQVFVVSPEMRELLLQQCAMTDTEREALCARIDELCQEIERLKGENGKLREQLKLMWLEVWASYYEGVIPYEVYKSTFDRLRELGIEVTP